MSDPNRFNIPVIEFITQLMREKFPSMNLSSGGPFYQTFVLPASVLIQPFRDRDNIIKRNQNLENYPVMSEEEMNRKSSNFIVDRIQGDRAYGIQRVFYEEVREVYISQEVVFSDDSDNRWSPISSVTLTSVQLAGNYIDETAEFFVDVAVISEADGEEYEAEEGQVNRFSNIIGATRTINPRKFTGGKNIETNTELYARILKSITNRDLVKEDAIAILIQENFPSVRDVKVTGFGDPDMVRDVVEAVISVDDILRYSFCRKVNLPLDQNGEVNWFDDVGVPIISPLGGWVACIADVTGVDYNSVVLASDSRNSTIISVQPGFVARVYAGYTGDPDEGDFTVQRVEEVPLEPNGTLVKVLRLDRPFSDPQMSSWDPVADLDKYSYSLLGAVETSHFHVGGKVDALIDSTADEEDSVIISILPEIAPGFSEIPLTDSNPTNPSTNNPLFEDNKAFRLPVLNVLRVEQIDFETDTEVERELLPDVHYVIVRAESRGRFTTADEDILIIKGFEADDVTPAFTGRRIKIHYTMNPDIPLIQDFVNSREKRDVTKDILVKPKNTAVLDIELEYEGSPDEETVDIILSEYIQSKGFGGTVSVHEVDTLLALYGVTRIKHPVQFRVRRDLGNGITQTEASEDTLTSQSTEVFYPASPLSVTKVG